MGKGDKGGKTARATTNNKVNQMNPNNPAYAGSRDYRRAMADNRSNQLNPNSDTYRRVGKVAPLEQPLRSGSEVMPLARWAGAPIINMYTEGQKVRRKDADPCSGLGPCRSQGLGDLPDFRLRGIDCERTFETVRLS